MCVTILSVASFVLELILKVSVKTLQLGGGGCTPLEFLETCAFIEFSTPPHYYNT